MPGNERDDAEGERHRHHVEPGGPGAERERPFEQVRRHEQHAEGDEVGEQCAGDPAAERSPPEEAEIEHRMARPALPGEESDARRRAGAEERDDAARAPPPALPDRDGDEERRHRRHEQGEPGPVERDPFPQMARARDERQPRRDADDAHRNVDEEDQAPSARRDERPTDARPERQPERLRRPLHADRTRESRPGHREVDDRQAVRLEHRRADALGDAEAVERGEVRREPARRRPEDEHAEAVDVEQFAPGHVGEPADHGDEGDEGDEVAQPDPGHGADAGVKGVLERGEGERDDAGVELAHERADADGADREPVRLRALADRSQAARFDGEQPDHSAAASGVAGRRLNVHDASLGQPSRTAPLPAVATARRSPSGASLQACSAAGFAVTAATRIGAARRRS